MVAYTVGRFQPPTIGHKRLIQTVIDAAKDGKAYVFVSSTMTPKDKNPLTSAQKMPILQHMFPSGNVTFVDTAKCDPSCGGALAAFYYLINNEKHDPKDITLVVGDDRKDVFGPGADIWKRKVEKDVYGPGGFMFLPSAARDMSAPATDEANMSGTKARAYAREGKEGEFYTALGYGNADDKSAPRAIYDIIRSSPAGRKGGNNMDLESLDSADYEGGRRSSATTRRRRKKKLKVVRSAKVSVIHMTRRN